MLTKKQQYFKNYYEDHKDKIREKQNAWTSSEAGKLARSEYYLEHKGEYAERHKRWVADNAEARKQYRKEWYQENKARINKKQRKAYVSKKKENVGKA